MADVSPGIAIGTFVGGIFTVLKLVVEVIKYRNNKRLRDAEKTIGPSIRPPPPAASPPATSETPLTLSLEIRLQAKEVELMRAQYQLDQLSVKLGEAQKRESQLAARVTEQELLNKQLVEEMARLRREGVSHAEHDVAGAGAHHLRSRTRDGDTVHRDLRAQSSPRDRGPSRRNPDR